jgi:hypothetical protein
LREASVEGGQITHLYSLAWSGGRPRIHSCTALFQLLANVLCLVRPTHAVIIRKHLDGVTVGVKRWVVLRAVLIPEANRVVAWNKQ